MDMLANAAEACAVVKMTPAVTPAGLATYAHFAHGDHGDDGGRARCCRPGLRDRGSNACIAAAWKSPFAATSLLSAVLDAITNAFSRPSANAHVITRSPHRSRAVVAIVGARAYIALSCVCARWGGVRHPGTPVRAAALQFKFPI